MFPYVPGQNAQRPRQLLELFSFIQLLPSAKRPEGRAAYPTCCPLIRFSHIPKRASKMLRATGHARMVTRCARPARQRLTTLTGDACAHQESVNANQGWGARGVHRTRQTLPGLLRAAGGPLVDG